MKTVIISCFDTYMDRVKLLKDFYSEIGDDVTVILSNFSHRKKQYIVSFDGVDQFVKAKIYTKNMSVARLRSHYNFSKKIYQKLIEMKPERIHCLVPANSLAKFVSKYKKENPSVNLIFDIIDLWPETMPIGNIKKYPPFTFWKNIRDNYLSYADIVFSECQLFTEMLHRYNKQLIIHTLRWAKEDTHLFDINNVILKDTEISLCYLGSLNNIIDIDMIMLICSKLNNKKTVTLHIIGDGEAKTELLNKLNEKKVRYIDHGLIFNPKKKQKIFDQCNYGLNIMKDSVCVGLTMKSLDYLCAGLPIINTIKGDSEKYCENNHIGINVSRNNIDEVIEYILSELPGDNIAKRTNAHNLFTKQLSKESMFSNLKHYIITSDTGYYKKR